MTLRISRRLLAQVSLDSLSPYYLTGPRFGSVSLAIAKVDEYLAEAAHLQRRVTRARRRVAGRLTEAAMLQRKRPARFPFAAIHFYANCWTIIRQHLEVIRDQTAFPRVGRALRGHNKLFDLYNDIRNHYEHFKDRLPGQKHHSRLNDPGDLGNLWDTTLTIGGKHFDVGPTSLKALRSIVAEVMAELKYAVLERLAIDQPKEFRRVIQRAQTDVALRRLQQDWPSGV